MYAKSTERDEPCVQVDTHDLERWAAPRVSAAIKSGITSGAITTLAQADAAMNSAVDGMDQTQLNAALKGLLKAMFRVVCIEGRPEIQ